MRHALFALVLLLTLSAGAYAAKLIAQGATSQSIAVVIYNSDGDPNTAGATIANLDLYVLLDGHAMSAKTDLVALAADHTAWTSGRAYHQGQGLYRVDIPDANLANAAGSLLTYLVVDAVSHNRTAYYEVQLSPPVDVNRVTYDDFASVTDVNTAMKDVLDDQGLTAAAASNLSLLGNVTYGLDALHTWLKKIFDNLP